MIFERHVASPLKRSTINISMVNLGMKCVVAYAFLIILVFDSSLIGQGFTEAEAEFNTEFRNLIRYEKASSQPSFEDSNEFKKQLEDAGKKVDEFFESVMRDPNGTGVLMFSVFEKTTSAGRKCDLINFAGDNGLGKELFLPVMRLIVNDSYSPIAHDNSLIASATIYIGQNGEYEDIKALQLLAKYSSSYGNSQIANGAIKEIQKREGVSVKEDKRLPLWAFIIGSIVVIGIVFMLVSNRSRTSRSRHRADH